jgi:putative ABC transport system substrate-binding protein
MAAAADPIATGLISSLARPGGNITGLSATATELYAKALELIREVLPSARRVGVLANPADPFSNPFVEQIQDAGRAMGITIQTFRVRGVEEFDAAFRAMSKEQANAVIVQGSLPRKPAIDLALKHHLLSMGATSLLAREGGLISYSVHQIEMYRRAAFYVDRILKGAKPADLPVEQPTRYELIINLKTAKSLGLDVPPTVLARADEVIE